MSKQDDGGPVFPQPLATDPMGGLTWPHVYGLAGMSLRDAFAIAALPAMKGEGG